MNKKLVDAFISNGLMAIRASATEHQLSMDDVEKGLLTNVVGGLMHVLESGEMLKAIRNERLKNRLKLEVLTDTMANIQFAVAALYYISDKLLSMASEEESMKVMVEQEKKFAGLGIYPE